MPPLDDHKRMFAYDRWANAAVLSALRVPGGPPPRSLRFMAHVLAAEELWLGRLKREQAAVVVWPDLTLDQCDAAHARIAPLWEGYLGSLKEKTLAERVEYVNSKGKPWTSVVGDVLAHVVMHSAYHRGQIAADMRASGFEPAYTDFIHAVRQGFVR